MRKEKDESEISSLASGAGDADESLQDGDQEGEVLKKATTRWKIREKRGKDCDIPRNYWRAYKCSPISFKTWQRG